MRNKNLNLQLLKVAAFDWDNTLALNKKALVESVNEVLQNHNMPEWDKFERVRNPKLSFRDNFPNIFGQYAAERYAEYREIYLGKIGNMIKAPQKAAEMLDFLHSQGIKNIIVSNKDRVLLEYELPLIYSPDLFDAVVCGHEAPKDKPNPEHLQYGAYHFIKEITPQNVWMIGDSPMDSECALNAGALSIRIGKPLWSDKEEKNENILFFADFASLYKNLTERFSE